MTDKEYKIINEAANLLEHGGRYSCICIGVAATKAEKRSYFPDEPLVDRYCAFLGEADGVVLARLFGATNLKENQNARILALCFFAELEDEV